MNNQIPIIIVKNVQRLMSDPEHLILVIGTTTVEKKMGKYNSENSYGYSMA